MIRMTAPASLALLFGLGLLVSACAPQSEPAGGGGALGTSMQPTASPDEVQDEQPQAETGVAQ